MTRAAAHAYYSPPSTPTRASHPATAHPTAPRNGIPQRQIQTRSLNRLTTPLTRVESQDVNGESPVPLISHDTWTPFAGFAMLVSVSKRYSHPPNPCLHSYFLSIIRNRQILQFACQKTDNPNVLFLLRIMPQWHDLLELGMGWGCEVVGGGGSLARQRMRMFRPHHDALLNDD